MEEAGLRGSGEIRAPAGARDQAPARVLGSPLGGNLHEVAEGAAGLESGNEVLLEAFGDALLVDPEVDGLADDAGTRQEEESARCQ